MDQTQHTPVRAAAPDFLRVVSLAIVAWYHFWQQSWLNPNISIRGFVIDIYPLIRCGYMFVYNLILISGFVLILSRLNGKYKTPWQFYKNRLVRILPSYFLCIGIFLVLSNLPGGIYDWHGGKEHMRVDLLSHLTFTHNLFAQSYNGTGLNVALWTLAVEVQFYALFPLLGHCFEKKPFVTYALMVLVSFLSKLYVHVYIEDTTLYINRLPAMLDVFANGMLCAMLFFKWKDTNQFCFIHLLLVVASCIGMYITVRDLSYLSGGEEARRAQMWGASVFSVFGGVFLLSGSLCYKWIRAFLSSGAIRFFAGISYNFYIWHQPIAVWFKKYHIPDYTEEYPNMSGNVSWQYQYMLLSVLAALIVATIVTYLIEKPCSRFLSSLSCKRIGTLFRRNNNAYVKSADESNS